MMLPDDADLLYIAEEGVSNYLSCNMHLVKSTSAITLASLLKWKRRNLLCKHSFRLNHLWPPTRRPLPQEILRCKER